MMTIPPSKSTVRSTPLHPPRRRRAKHSDGGGHGGNSERWLVSYADLVTLLFALFVVLYAAADHDRAQKVAEAIAMQFNDAKTSHVVMDKSGGILPDSRVMVSTRESLEKSFAANQKLKDSTTIKATKGGMIISLADAGFFAAGEAELRPDALSMIDALAASIKDSSTMIRVEGHTDSVPIATSRFPSNWELSTARANTMLAQLIERGIEPSRLSVAGYAGERPVADNSTPEGRAQNRRVDLVVLQ
ncbi:MAG TPA: OmpA family protein [Pyrinomonadaceae bacterium]|jgi:chemotaxis protein MotB|nr:OmpA family protein [Pyrinomonadaceae bacterium]